jgi:hypothetical protein
LNPDFKYIGIACGIHGRIGTVNVTDFAGDYIENE